MAGEEAGVREDEARVCSKPNPSSIGDISNPAPSLPPSTANGGGELQCGSDQMVDIELYAARALADLARTALLESRYRGRESGGSERDDSGRRSWKRIKSGSPSRAREKSFQNSKISRSKHSCLVADQHEDEKASEDMMDKRVEVLQNSGLHRSGINCDTSHPSFCGRPMKENLGEVEKEAKRIRRVLANRESARQTIRRRQALREELAKKVADLSLDNENMKMEKDLATKEYLILKENNKQLKEQIAKTIRRKAKRSAKFPSAAEVESSTKLPFAVCNRAPTAPYICPPWPYISPDIRSWYDEGNPLNISGLRAPLFVPPPYAWFYPSIHQASGCCPPYSHASNDRDHEDALGRRQDLNLCSRAIDDDADKTSFCSGSRTDVSPFEKERDLIQTNWKPSCYRAENHGMPSPPPTLNPCPVVKSEPCAVVRDELRIDESPGVTMYPHEKLVDPKAATEARKRRKELTRLKHLHGRQVRPHR